MGLTTIGAALAPLGVQARDNEELIIVDRHNGAMRHRVLCNGLADEPLAPDTYIATGRFRAGAVQDNRGRSVDNVASVWTLVVDSDLQNRIKLDPRTLEAEELKGELAAHLREIIAVVKGAGLHPNIIACTGYGYSLWYLLEDDDQGDVPTAQALNRELVAALNRAAGRKLADPQVSDAGTRIMRIPGSANHKNPERERRSMILHEDGGQWTLAALGEALAALPQPEPERLAIAPRESAGSDLTPGAVDDIVRAVAPSWEAGQRHSLALALAGKLRRNGVAQWQAEHIIERLAAGDEERADRLRAVRTTYAGARVAGQSRLVGLLPTGDAARVDEVLSAFWRAQQPKATATPELVLRGNVAQQAPPEDAREAGDFAPLPDVVLQGATGEYLDIMQGCTEAPAQFHVGAFLAACGALAGRTAYTPYASKALYANQYVILVGDTGTSKKDTAINFAVSKFALLEGHARGNLVLDRFAHLEDAGSAEALLKVLETRPNTLLVLREFAGAIAKMRSKGRESLFDLMLTLWDANGVYQNKTLANPITVYNPTFSLLAAIQPDRFRVAMVGQVLSSGFANRPLVIPGAGVAPLSNPPSVDTGKSGALLLEILDRYDDMQSMAGGGPLALPMSDDCAGRWRAYYEAQWWAAKRDPALAETASRNPDLVRKIALHYAMTELDRAIPQRLEWRHIEAGIALVGWKTEANAKLMAEWGEGEEERLEGRIKRALEKRGPLDTRTLKQGTYIKGVPTTVWNRAFEALRKSGEVAETEEAGVFALVKERSAA